MYLPPPLSARVRYDTRLFLSGVWIQFSFYKTGRDTKVKERSLPYYLLMAGGS